MWYLPTSMMGWDDTTLGVYRYRCGAGDEREEGKRGRAARIRGVLARSLPRDFGVRVTRVPLQFMAREERGKMFALLEKEGVRERGR